MKIDPENEEWVDFWNTYVKNNNLPELRYYLSLDD
jgi:hypothetical protein